MVIDYHIARLLAQYNMKWLKNISLFVILHWLIMLYKCEMEALIMKKQSAAGLFFSTILRAAVVIVGILIIVFGIMFLLKVVDKDKKENDEPLTTVGENVLTESEVPDELLSVETTVEVVTEAQIVADSRDKKILVLNSTDVTGLAGRWVEALAAEGYANATASDYSEIQATTRIIAVEEGVGQDLLQYFNGATYEVGTVTSGTSADTAGIDIVIIIGSADDAK